ncbi:Acetyltransferase (GNAT) domain protein [uncultured archaeon]|nr:Acetyltransferase (GNAT) domain protein [uncultured archaeon]
MIEKNIDRWKMENTQFQIIWDNTDQHAWDKLLESAGRSNLLQCWAYGETKANVEGWKVLRGLIIHEGSAIAMFQALEKRWPIIGGIVRINRGPLWLHKFISSENVSAVYALIRRQWSWRNRKILFMAPELLNTPENSLMLSLQGYHPRRKYAWRSAWLDLGMTEDELRKALKKKWRNMLNSGERANLTLEVSFSDEDFQWLIEQYKKMMLIKRFKGMSIDLLFSLRNHMKNKDQMPVMRAMSEGKPIAGVLIVRHGLACTYLVGWNSPEGRTLKAHNFLLWNAALEMKRKGCMWFDLGGISDEETPEIALFKRGMGGEEYQLVGEWWQI